MCSSVLLNVYVSMIHRGVEAQGGTPYNGLYGEAPPERGSFLRLMVYKRVGISQVEVYKRVRKSVIWVFKMAFNYNISNRCSLWLYEFIY